MTQNRLEIEFTDFSISHCAVWDEPYKIEGNLHYVYYRLKCTLETSISTPVTDGVLGYTLADLIWDIDISGDIELDHIPLEFDEEGEVVYAVYEYRGITVDVRGMELALDYYSARIREYLEEVLVGSIMKRVANRLVKIRFPVYFYDDRQSILAGHMFIRFQADADSNVRDIKNVFVDYELENLANDDAWEYVYNSLKERVHEYFNERFAS